MPAAPASGYRACVAKTCSLLVALGLLGGCSSLLPSTKEVTATGSTWQRYQDAEQTFDKIVPGQTTTADLRGMNLDPASNSSVTILQHWEVTQRFVVNQTVSLDDLDPGVRECIVARAQCRAYEINHVSTNTKRSGNAVLDVLRVYRETHTGGWRFSGLILMKDGVVLYKLTGGQPLIHQIEEKEDRLGPLQALAGKLNLNVNGITGSIAGTSAPASGDAQPALGVAALKRP
jgi:hypothetical protein